MDPPSPSPRHQPLSRASSGQTVRPSQPSPSGLLGRLRRRRGSAAGAASGSDSDGSNSGDGNDDVSDADDAGALSGNGHPPPLWREASDVPLGDDDDPESGPSDYWRRPGADAATAAAASPLIPFHFRSRLNGAAPVSPSLQAAANEPADADISIDAGPAGVGGGATAGGMDGDDDVFARRIHDVLDPPPDSPRLSRREKNRILSRTSTASASLAGDVDGPLFSGDKPTGVYAATYREIVGEKAEGEEEFGVLGTPILSRHAVVHLLALARSHAEPKTTFLSPYALLWLLWPLPASALTADPSISRLRSHPRTVSSSSARTTPPRVTHTRTPSHFSTLSMSRSESATSVSLPPEPAADVAPQPGAQAGPAFAFHPLRALSAHLYGRDGARAPRKAGSVLGLGGKEERELGRPTLMDVNGVIAVGTDGGYVAVYAFSQDLKHVLGTDSTVTALTISPDQTYVAIGHASGHIYLYDLSSPSRPARHVPPHPLRQVLSGRKEGHLEHSAVIHLGFVGARHTAIVSGDNEGRAFWWSLGKVMGVESNDVVRMLGSYPDPGSAPRPATPSSPNLGVPGPGSPGLSLNGVAPSLSRATSIQSQTRKTTTLFAALPLPLGAPHATDALQVAALLTPAKLVVVAMKPEPKTWFRRMRDGQGGAAGGLAGCAAWLRAGEVDGAGPSTAGTAPSDPVLVYSWGTSVRFLRVKVSDGTPEFVEGRRWEAEAPVRALQWYDADHVLLVTDSSVVLLNVVSLKPVEDTPLQTKLLTSLDVYAGLSKVAPAPEALGGSVRAHRGKLFLLTRSNVQVGTLLRWSDRILALVHTGDFLGAIHLAVAYYLDTAPGNRIGLPSDPDDRQSVTAARVRELIGASLDWAFSEDRMRDDTHFSADGRGVDLTALFEGLAAACVAASAALGDGAVLYDTAWEHFSNAGIHAILLRHLEPAFFEGAIPAAPPHIVQALIREHEAREEWDLAEAVIWHADRGSLDIDLALRVCEARKLWDALIWVWEAMGDYVAPLVRLLRAVQDGGEDGDDDEAAYRLYAYLDAVLSGLSYPSLMPLGSEAAAAQAAVYGFVFSDRTVCWPAGGDEVRTTGRGTPEPAYPYLRALLRLDMEAFLHALDGAFEDSYLNDGEGVVNRQSIVTLMLDIVDPPAASPDLGRADSAPAFDRADVTLLHIFVARNLPKYPQFVLLPPSVLHRILAALCADPDRATAEDRQLAAESLLCAYTPHDADEAARMYERAGFWRLLRAAHERERDWAGVVRAALAEGDDVYAEIERVAALCRAPPGKGGRGGRGGAGGAAGDAAVEEAVRAHIPALLDGSVRQTAATLERAFPRLHADAVARLAPHRQLVYLGLLVDPSDDDAQPASRPPGAPAPPPPPPLPLDLRHRYASLLATYEPAALPGLLDRKGPAYFDLPRLAAEAEAEGAVDAAVWALGHCGRRADAARLAESTVAGRGVDVCDALRDGDEGRAWAALEGVKMGVRVGVRLCRDEREGGDGGDGGGAANGHAGGDARAAANGKADGQVEDRWYAVLRSLTDVVQAVGAIRSGARAGGKPGGASPAAALAADAAAELDALVAETLAELSAAHVSFPALFKRLVAPAADASAHAPYAHLRPVLAGMLASSAHRADVLRLAVKMVGADAGEQLAVLVAGRSRGLRAVRSAEQARVLALDGKGARCRCGGGFEGGYAVGVDGLVCRACAQKMV